MHKFETYIDSIVGSLKISKKKKTELTEEFKDHLESLKLDFIEKGFPEGVAIQRAIEIFGESNSLKKKLYISLSIFRNIGNVLFGVLIFLTILILCYIPIVCNIAFLHYISVNNVFSQIFIAKWNILLSVLFFIPIGYFSPIILNRIFKIAQLAFSFSIFGLLVGACFNIVLAGTINIEFILKFFAGGLLGGMAGYVILIAVNSLNMIYKNVRVKRFIQQ